MVEEDTRQGLEQLGRMLSGQIEVVQEAGLREAARSLKAYRWSYMQAVTRYSSGESIDVVGTRYGMLQRLQQVEEWLAMAGLTCEAVEARAVWQEAVPVVMGDATERFEAQLRA